MGHLQWEKFNADLCKLRKEQEDCSDKLMEECKKLVSYSSEQHAQWERVSAEHTKLQGEAQIRDLQYAEWKDRIDHLESYMKDSLDNHMRRELSRIEIEKFQKEHEVHDEHHVALQLQVDHLLADRAKLRKEHEELNERGIFCPGIFIEYANQMHANKVANEDSLQMEQPYYN